MYTPVSRLNTVTCWTPPCAPWPGWSAPCWRPTRRRRGSGCRQPWPPGSHPACSSSYPLSTAPLRITWRSRRSVEQFGCLTSVIMPIPWPNSAPSIHLEKPKKRWIVMISNFCFIHIPWSNSASCGQAEELRKQRWSLCKYIHSLTKQRPYRTSGEAFWLNLAPKLIMAWNLFAKSYSDFRANSNTRTLLCLLVKFNT